MNVTKALSKSTLALFLFFIFLLSGIMHGHAQEPPRLSSHSYLHDAVGIIERPDEITEKLERLAHSETALHLVVIENFSDPADPKKWNKKFRNVNGISSGSLLLTVATQGKYQVDIPKSAVLNKERQRALNNTIKSSLSQAKTNGEWTASLSAIVDAVRDAVNYRPPTTGERDPAQKPSGGFRRAFFNSVITAGIVAAAVWWYLKRGRKRYPASSNNRDMSPQNPVPDNPFHDASYADLEAQSSRLLVAADDAIKSSAQETSFAEAQFGAEAIEAFRKSLTAAQKKLRNAFRYRQLLDDEEPDTPQEQRNYFDSIIRLCTEINDELDANKVAFDELRSLETNALDVIKKIRIKTRKAQDRLPREAEKLRHAKQEYFGAAIKAIQDNPEEAKERLLFINTALNNAEEKLSHNKSAEATIAIKAAEEAADQAHALLDAVTKTSEDLEQASQALENEISAAASTIAEARAINAVDSHPKLIGAAAGLEETVNLVKNKLSTPPIDPIALTNRLEDARNAIDRFLNAAPKNLGQHRKRARDTFAQAVSLARSNIHSAEYYIQNRRGGINVQARTRISEAQRCLEQALGLRESDEEGALELVRQANRYAQEANDLAQQNVHEHQHNRTFGGNSGFGLGGAILGGILIDSMLSNRRGGDYYGDDYNSFGGDLFGGGGYGGFSGNGGDFSGGDSF